MAKLKKIEETKKKKKNMTIAQLKEYMYKGSGKDPAVNELIKKLKKDGGGSLDSSGFGNRWKVEKKTKKKTKTA